MPNIKPKSLKDKLKGVKMPKLKPKLPVWEGPCGAGPNGGVTQSLLSRFLCCRERFRLLVVEGLKPADAFDARLEFGNMWHVCEERYAVGGNPIVNNPVATSPWESGLLDYCKELCARYPMDREKVDHWYQICRALFPLYVAHWADHPDVQTRTPLLAEQVFDVPYKLPSGRTVRLRGKWDSVDLVTEEIQVKGSAGVIKTSDIWLQENKTKSSIDGQKLNRQLTFDLQTMLYLVALERSKPPYQGLDNQWMSAPIAGVRYNVIRRSAHKSVEAMLKKVDDDRKAGRMDEWFARWNVTVTPADVVRFRRECLDPVLEQLCDWWAWVTYCEHHKDSVHPFDVFAPPTGKPFLHFRFPHGVYNPVSEGGFGDVDAYLESGSEVGLQRATNLFPELT